MITINNICAFVKDTYGTNDFIPLHAPQFVGNERSYVNDTLDSTFVSSVGQYVDQFEQRLCQFTHSQHAVATVNGTTALHAALYAFGVSHGDLVITQALTFVATCNAISQLGAEPVFIDVDANNLGLSSDALSTFLESEATIVDDKCIHTVTGKTIKGIVPMHTFGHSADLDELLVVCQRWHLFLLEDAAESVGSFYKEKHTGTLGDAGVFSFNGNKIITTGGGGAVISNNSVFAKRMKHLTTTAKLSHPFEFEHDEIAFNYRMPNINAALGCGQMEMLTEYLSRKRQLAMTYKAFFTGSDYRFVDEPAYGKSNFWLNAVKCVDLAHRNQLLKETNDAGVMTRPVWKLMNELPMYANCIKGELDTSRWLSEVLVNLPSSPILERADA